MTRPLGLPLVVLRTLIVSDFSKRFSDVKRPKLISYGQSVPITPHYGNFGRGAWKMAVLKHLRRWPLIAHESIKIKCLSLY
ncbi:protein of unknown function [Thauera humireducens]|nr:protein of unknown function [Thauera humireducens]